jgi:hypothetical protein
MALNIQREIPIPKPIRSLALLVCMTAAGLVPAADALFVRGDCNADGDPSCQVTDPLLLLGYLFQRGEKPPCLEACNSNGDERLDVTDAVYFLLHCFAGGPSPPAPYPACGSDPTPALSCDGHPPCEECASQDARGVGECARVVGVFWDGSRCSTQSGCSCEGEDCGDGFDSLEECYAAHGRCDIPCDALDATAVGACEKLLGVSWNGRQCRLLSGCECVGADCDDLYDSLEECAAAVEGCPANCTPMDVHDRFTCEPIQGYYWDGGECKGLTGCECEGLDCDKLFVTPEACAAAHEECI